MHSCKTTADRQSAIIQSMVQGLGTKTDFLWSEVVDAVNNYCPFSIKNWIEVRVALQSLTKGGHLRRTDNVFEERYIIVP